TANEIPGRVEEVADSGRVLLATEIGPLWGESAHPLTVGQRVTAFSRPESWRVLAPGPVPENTWEGRLVEESFHGFYTDMLYSGGPRSQRVRSVPARSGTGRRQRIGVDAAHVRVLPGGDDDSPS